MSSAAEVSESRGARRLAPLCALLVLTSSAFAGDERILGRHDLEFARALVRSNYPDLAEELLSTVENGKSRSKDDQLLAQALRLELAEFAASADPDPVRQGAALEQVVKDMENFVSVHPGTGAADEVSDRLLELYRTFGERVAAMLLKEETKADAKKLRGAGEKMFERAIDSLKTERETLDKKRDELEEPDLEVERRAILVAYNLARAYYFHAQLLEDEFLRSTRLKNCLEVLADIQLNWSDQLLCFEGYIYEGLCLKELKKPDEALLSFDYAIGLRKSYTEDGQPDSRGFYPVDDQAADIISSAVLQKMILLSEKGDDPGAIEAAKDFFATIPDAGRALKGLAILDQQAGTLKKLGDAKGVEAIAQRMIELDPRGSGGERGRELLGGAAEGSLGAVDTYKLAEAAARRGEVERAIALCQQTMIAARGTASEADLGSQSVLLIGALFAGKEWLHEAVVAWSSVTQRYAKGKEAPECLWRAANGYLALQARERGSFYKDGAREAMSEISKRYPQHRYASMAAIIEGQQLESEEQFEKAADVYLRIPAGSAGHEESQYRAGNAYAGQMRKLFKEQKPSEAKAAGNKAEEQFKKAREVLEKAAKDTLDVAAQERLRTLAFNARVGLANLYLTKGVDRAAQVSALFEGVEREFAGDDVKLSLARQLRLKALLSLGKIDEAAQLLDQLLKENPDAKGLSASASTLARAMDERGLALKGSNSVESETMLRRAASYYVIAVRDQVQGVTAVRVDELEPIANRLFALALQFNGVPDSVESFVEWKATKLDGTLLEVVARAYEALLAVSPSYRNNISLARVLGFLQRWEDATDGYARLFEREDFINLGTRTINTTTMTEKPELTPALLEWGMCEREIGVAKTAPERLSRASSIFEALVVGTREGSKNWWPAKFWQLQTMFDRGDYETGKIGIDSVERTNPDFDGGLLKERFQRLSKEFDKRVKR
ncbi:MAG: hypothetical protein EXS08_16175 [Planctomycetes bacterium]|nr:hypothetical protein [Planctomycetota bacterium]